MCRVNTVDEPTTDCLSSNSLTKIEIFDIVTHAKQRRIEVVVLERIPPTPQTVVVLLCGEQNAHVCRPTPSRDQESAADDDTTRAVVPVHNDHARCCDGPRRRRASRALPRRSHSEPKLAGSSFRSRDSESVCAPRHRVP